MYAPLVTILFVMRSSANKRWTAVVCREFYREAIYRISYRFPSLFTMETINSVRYKYHHA